MLGRSAVRLSGSINYRPVKVGAVWKGERDPRGRFRHINWHKSGWIGTNQEFFSGVQSTEVNAKELQMLDSRGHSEIQTSLPDGPSSSLEATDAAEKTLEDPAIPVIFALKSPPVQLSATNNFAFFSKHPPV